MISGHSNVVAELTSNAENLTKDTSSGAKEDLHTMLDAEPNSKEWNHLTDEQVVAF